MLRYIQEIESSSTQSKPEETQQYFEKKKIPAEKLGKNIEKYLNTPIKRDKYTAIFKSVFELYGLDIPIIHEERSSIYDSENALRIPTSPEYNSISLQRILALIQHEIECHYINLKNSRKAIGNVRGKDNLEKEEGIATVSEYLLEGYKIEQLDFVVGSLPSILAGELLQGDDFEDFTRLMRIMEGEGRDSSPHSLFLRRKRNYPLEQRGVQHKDTSYTRGLFKTIEYIAE